MPIGTRRFSNRLRDTKKKFWLCCLLSIGILGLSACDRNPVSNTGISPGQKATATVAPPSSVSDNAPVQTSFGGVPPLEIKQGGSLGSLGLNLEPLFTENLSSDARIARLENTIVAVQEDLRTLAPSMQRLAVIEQDLEALVGQLEAVLQEERGFAPPPVSAAPLAETLETPLPLQVDDSATLPDETEITQTIESTAPLELTPPEPEATPPPLTPAPEIATPPPAPTPAPVAAAPPPSVTAPKEAGLVVSGLRLGEHPGRTRLVFDMTGKTNFRSDFDNAEKILIVEIEQASWSGAASQTLSSPLVQSYSTQKLESGPGTRIILVLKKNARVSDQSSLEPGAGNPNHRIVIDLTHE